MTVMDGAEDSLADTGDRIAEAGGATADALALRAESDIELLRLVRAGHDAAFGELFSRHAASVRRFAMRCTSDVADAEDMAAEAFFRVLQAVRRGSGPDDNVRAYLLTVVRRLAAEWSVRRRDVPVADEELSRQVDAGYAAPVSGADLQLIVRAFSSLPQRWRTVLWQVEVEGERPAVVARRFGLSANATAALARRARQGLQAAYLQAHLAPAGGNATVCGSVVEKLGAFTAGQMTPAESRRIAEHLTGCASCQALQAELADVCAGLRRYAGSLTPPVLGAGLGAHHVLGGHPVLLGKLAAVGARFKLGIAAVSMAAVGGFGVAAGPLVAHIDPVFHADRGEVGPVLLSSVDSGVPVVLSHVGVRFDPTMRSELRGPVRQHEQLERAPGTSAAVTSTTTGDTGVGRALVPAGGGADGGADGSSSVTDTDPTTTGTDGSSASMQLQEDTFGLTTTTTDPVALSTTPTGRAGVEDTSTPPTKSSVWSTSWTTDGTAVWETVWSWSDGVR
jgi:RNA polymerase sigma factor (sigma-70 family)